ncbi:MAG: sulfatase-like hydrolase/transferase [Desulfovibrio sp.]|nr:sulfatase-like hydrolase/transferase [Desulfovibrio sp.]
MHPIDFPANHPILVVYIGEATTCMNWSLYGYTRKTTPLLDAIREQEENLLVFRNVLSTHTHTTPSLLEALSFPADAEIANLPIQERKRISLVDVLSESGIPCTLFSTQLKDGTWNLGAKTIFRMAATHYAEKTSFYDASLLDDAYLRPGLLESLKRPDPGAIFLHSTAGHGPYLDLIPESYHAPVDDLVGKSTEKAILGIASEKDSLDAYDSAMRYVDACIADAIRTVQADERPIVFVYFSDHGESPFTGRAHDSTRFIHDMTRIPFLIYFNKAARAAAPDTFEKYRGYANGGAVATLAQLPGTIVDLLGGMPPSALVMGAPDPSAKRPVMVRQVAAKDGGKERPFSYVSLSGDDGLDERLFRDVTDEATSIFNLSLEMRPGGRPLCYHAANSFAKAVRGAAITNCLEFDLALQADGGFEVVHPPHPPVGLKPETIYRIAEKGDLHLWLDVKGVAKGGDCERLRRHLAEHGPRPEKTLVELPSDLDATDASLGACVRGMRDAGYSVSYYIPTEMGEDCAAGKKERCAALRDRVVGIASWGVFSDISFDHGIVEAVAAIPEARGLRWNTWGLTPKTLRSLPPGEDFNFVILKSKADPNSRRD